MKRKYEKPILSMENYQLNAALASSCSSQGYTRFGSMKAIALTTTDSFIISSIARSISPVMPTMAMMQFVITVRSPRTE